MTKKHYIKLASLYRELLTAPIDDKAEIDGIQATISATVKVLREENPNFDTERFARACGLR